MEHAEDTSSLISKNNSLLISKTDSVVTTQLSHNALNSGGRLLADIWDEYNIINNGRGNHKGGKGRAHDMKTHFALKCKEKVPREIRIKILRDLQSIDESAPSGSSKSTILKKQKLDYPSSLSLDAYYNTIEAIDKAKEARANQSLIR
ncbi:26290_t:CDS:2 [Gigaspora margarita]|uniref:26290_t:CDS:1 n=1 Tax=Gigaspora margarita TaxID=4874 RepID=A0ABN7WSS7_GIGMA|nr:26290_t:CDS:2 [Gigaspora margarita]